MRIFFKPMQQTYPEQFDGLVDAGSIAEFADGMHGQLGLAANVHLGENQERKNN